MDSEEVGFATVGGLRNLCGHFNTLMLSKLKHILSDMNST